MLRIFQIRENPTFSDYRPQVRDTPVSIGPYDLQDAVDDRFRKHNAR